MTEFRPGFLGGIFYSNPLQLLWVSDIILRDENTPQKGEAMRKRELNITEGPLLGSMLRYAVPVILTSLL